MILLTNFLLAKIINLRNKFFIISKYFEFEHFELEIYFMTSTIVVANKVMVHLNWTDIISCPRKFTILDKKIDTRT